MPIIKHACSICKQVFDTERAALECEAKGQPSLLPHYTILMVSEYSHGDKHHVAIKSATYNGHEALYFALGNKKVLTHFHPADPRYPDFWGVLRELWQHIDPSTQDRPERRAKFLLQCATIKSKAFIVSDEFSSVWLLPRKSNEY